MRSIAKAVRALFASPASPVSGSAWAPVEQEVRSLLGQGKTARALRVAQRALAEAPGTPGRAYLHGLALDGVGRHEEALEAYRAELAINPGHAEARARCEQLTAALTRPAATASPTTNQRSWHTSLPRPTLLGLQKSLHNYQYRGVPLLKNPFDLALYPILLWKLQSRTVIEIGSKSGGSALWLGDLLAGRWARRCARSSCSACPGPGW